MFYTVVLGDKIFDDVYIVTIISREEKTDTIKQ